MSSHPKPPSWAKLSDDQRLKLARRLERVAKLIRATVEGQTLPPVCSRPWRGYPGRL